MRRLVPALAALLLLAGCGGGSSSAATETATPRPTAASASASASADPTGIGRYVALGDSYTAAPYVYLTDIAGGCLRSNHDYPAVLAQELKVGKLVDVSCSGARTSDIAGRQKTAAGSIKPQIRAVTRDTDLVTLGIGGNDDGLFASLVSGCSGGRSCTFSYSAANQRLSGTQQRVTQALRLIHRRAPHAKVVLVGYPRLAPTGKSCPSLPLDTAGLASAARLSHRFDTLLRAAARAGHASYLSLDAASRGHDICAGDAAWINGPKLDQNRAAPFHPFAVEQAAVARLLARMLG